MSRTEGPESAQIVQKTYDLVLWLLPKVEKLPRSFRFSIGERIVGQSLDLLLFVVQAAYSGEKMPLLDMASARSNGLRYLLRLAKDLKLLNIDSYAFASERLEQIGRMIGGWRKARLKRR